MALIVPLSTTLLMISISSALEMLLGMFWYTGLFGSQFLQLAYGRRRPHKLRVSKDDMTLTVALTLLRNTLFCLLLTALTPRGLYETYLLIFTFWVFVASFNYVNRIYEGTSRAAISVHGGYWLVVLCIQTTVFGATLLTFEPGQVAQVNLGDHANIQVTKA